MHKNFLFYSQLGIVYWVFIAIESQTHVRKLFEKINQQ